MDLGAYAQIDNLSQIMKDNGIYIPRLRGLRLMKDEEPVPIDELKNMAKEEGFARCADLCRSVPPFDWNSCTSELSYRTDAICEYYLVLPKYANGDFNHCDPIDIRWDRVHGKKRKAFKYVIKKAKKEVFQQYELWNKYAGRSDVLYIHCRLGAGNWNYYKGWEIIESQPWFLDKVEDYFDSTYLDVYAKIKGLTMARIDLVKRVIKDRYDDANCGLFFTRNWAGDPMTTIWEEDGVRIDICYHYSYFEVFGLTGEEENELSRFYDSMKGASNG